MSLYHLVPTLVKDDDFSEVNCIVEIPMGSQIKYEYKYDEGYIAVDRIGKTPIPYTFNYGDLPQTWNTGDNDPLDVLILSRHSFHPGVIVPARVIGGLQMFDSGEFDYKVVAVADDKYYEKVQNIGDLDEKEKEDISYFMLRYKDLHNKTVELKGWDTKEDAMKIIKESMIAYEEKYFADFCECENCECADCEAENCDCENCKDSHTK